MANIPTMPRAIGNRISTTLASPVDDNDLTFTVSSGTGFSSSGGYIILDQGLSNEEIVYVESVSSTTLTIATNGRGAAGSVAASHSAGAAVMDVVIDENVNGLIDTYSVEHNTDGTHITTSGTLAVLQTGWIPSGETWTYASADDPTYTFTISGDKTTKYSVGMRIRVSQSTGGTKYFIITAVSYGAPNTTVTVYGGTDYDLANETISSPYFSMYKAPVGFPLDLTKWRVYSDISGDTAQSSPVSATWYNINTATITVPIGAWRVGYFNTVRTQRAGGSFTNLGTTLSTANNSSSDSNFSRFHYGAAEANMTLNAHSEQLLILAAKQAYYLNCMVQDDGSSRTLVEYATSTGVIIYAECAYL